MKILAIIIASILALPSDTMNCKDLKNGKFQTENDDGSLTVITRKGKKQIEDFRNGERISEFEVKWATECEYLLFNRKVVKGIDPWPEINSDTFKIKIIEIQPNFYLTESELLSRGWKLNQKVEILE